MTDLRQAAQQALEALTIYSDAQCSLKGQAAITALRTALAQQAETPPEWPLIKNILAEYGLGAISFVAEFKAAQRPWVGLTDEEVRFYTEKHRALVNAHYDKVADTNIITEAFDSTAFYKDVSAVLKDRNG